MTVCTIHKELTNIVFRVRHLTASCETDLKFSEVLLRYLRQGVFCSTQLRDAVFRVIAKYCEMILRGLRL
jgi:hypothetical protein